MALHRQRCDQRCLAAGCSLRRKLVQKQWLCACILLLAAGSTAAQMPAAEDHILSAGTRRLQTAGTFHDDDAAAGQVPVAQALQTSVQQPTVSQAAASEMASASLVSQQVSSIMYCACPVASISWSLRSWQSPNAFSTITLALCVHVIGPGGHALSQRLLQQRNVAKLLAYHARRYYHGAYNQTVTSLVARDTARNQL